jgi:L-fuculose-phosphate aldolase
MFFLERTAWVDYHPPGSAELGVAVGNAAAQAEVIMLRNHGVILFDETFPDAVMRLQTLELACRIWLQARAADVSLKSVPAAQVGDFLASGRYRPRKPWHREP